MLQRRDAKARHHAAARGIVLWNQPPPWDTALPHIQENLQLCRRMGQGCKWCISGNCCLKMEEAGLAEVQRWREEMRGLVALACGWFLITRR